MVEKRAMLLGFSKIMAVLWFGAAITNLIIWRNQTALWTLGGAFILIFVFLFMARKYEKQYEREGVEKIKLNDKKIMAETFKCFLVGLFIIIVVVGIIIGKMDWLAPPSVPPFGYSAQVSWIFVFPFYCVLIGAVAYKLPAFYWKKHKVR
ncbi:MAG: hypothetical protein AB1305_02850 [Candidatus Hadarchaeota archaeon]